MQLPRSRVQITSLLLGLLFSAAALAAGAPPATEPVAVAQPGWQEALDRAKAEAGADRSEDAARSLIEAIDLGYADYFSLMYAGALAPVRAGADWPDVLSAFNARNPWAGSLRLLFDGSQEPWLRYRTAHAFMATQPVIPAAVAPTYRQLYATAATYVGEYEEADRHYGSVGGAAPALEAGYVTARDAIGPIVEAAKGAKAVFLNESHGRSNTRAANLLVIAELAELGFTHLALEAMAVGRDSGSCRTVVTRDSGLSARGYPVTTTGTYINDPVYGELVRVALASGLKVVGYDHQFDGPSIERREQAQAENLACLLKTEAGARLVVIGGFAHISESEDFRIPGGLMGARFKRLTGIDPLTVDLTTLLTLDESRLALPSPPGPAGGPLLLVNDQGQRWAREGFDFTVLVPAPRPRGQVGPHWLSLDGRRQRTVVTVPACESKGGCLLVARRASEQPEAVPVDRCVFNAGAEACVLYLPSGGMRVEMLADDGTRVGDPVRVEVAVPAPAAR